MEKNLDGLMLRTFVEAVRLGSITQASVVLDRSQPLVTQSIRRLEDLIGVKLLERSVKGVTLTEDGKSFLPYAQQIIALSDESLRQMEMRRSRSRKARRIDLEEDLAGDRVLTLIKEIASGKQAISLQVRSPDDASSVEAYARGDIDIFLGEPFPNGTVSIRPKRIGSTRLVWAGAPDFDATIRPLPVGLYPSPCQWRRHVVDALTGNRSDWFVAVESGSLAALQATARSGMALIACLPSTLGPGLVEINYDFAGLPPPPHVEIALYRSAGCDGELLMDQIENVLWETVS